MLNFGEMIIYTDFRHKGDTSPYNNLLFSWVSSFVIESLILITFWANGMCDPHNREPLQMVSIEPTTEKKKEKKNPMNEGRKIHESPPQVLL